LFFVKLAAKFYKKDPTMLPWLKQLVQGSESWSLRCVSLQSIAKFCKEDPKTILWLKQLVQKDSNLDLQCAALNCVLSFYRRDPKTLSWIKHLSQTSENWELRRFAIVQLSIVFGKSAICSPIEESQILDLFEKLVREDESWYVRGTVLLLLPGVIKSEEKLLELLQNRTLQDPFQREYDWQDNPRQIALKVFVQQYPEHPKTAELLRDRAQNDNDEQLRDWAKEQLVHLGLD
jgi:hypothetical protein